ncbi:MAG: hypothetical protein H0X41_04800 [Chitinophagaceae bacterium]|nr:hypothetical protein [Chitinophagaceae bacterium]
MRKIILAAIIILSTRLVFAQPVATDTRVEYQKGDKAAAVIELPYSPEIVAASIKDNMLKKGLKEEKSKGFQVFKGARLTPTDGEVVDMYFKTDRKNRKDNNVSVVYLIIGRPNENVALRTGDDSFKVEDAKSYLNSMTPTVDAYNLEMTIGSQETIIKKAEKHLNDLQDNQRDYEKKISNLNEKLTQTKRDIEIQTADVAKQRAARDAMVARRAVPTVN